MYYLYSTVSKASLAERLSSDIEGILTLDAKQEFLSEFYTCSLG